MNKLLPQRKKLRLKNYAYSTEGLYSITISTKDREMYFEDENIRNMVTTVWNELPNKYHNIYVDEHIIRNDTELNETREYIRNNPVNWDDNTENITGN